MEIVLIIFRYGIRCSYPGRYGYILHWPLIGVITPLVSQPQLFCGSGAQQVFLFQDNFRCTDGATFGVHLQPCLPPINPLWPPAIWMSKLLFFLLLPFYFSSKSNQICNKSNYFFGYLVVCVIEGSG